EPRESHRPSLPTWRQTIAERRSRTVARHPPAAPDDALHDEIYAPAVHAADDSRRPLPARRRAEPPPALPHLDYRRRQPVQRGDDGVQRGKPPAESATANRARHG